MPIEKEAIKGKKECSPGWKSVDAGGLYGNGAARLSQFLGLNDRRWQADGTWRWPRAAAPLGLAAATAAIASVESVA